jgi:hypothetical protein
MPYINDADRALLDPPLDNLVQVLNQMDVEDVTHTGWAGRVNYLVTRLTLRTLPSQRYWVMALGVGTLVCTIFEFYRRFVAPYEDAAIKKNGDIPEYKEAV